MIEIPLHNKHGERVGVALIDDEDSHLAERAWYLSSRGYAAGSRRIDGRKRSVLLHREIMGLQHGDGRMVDHRSRDQLDCRRENLRIVTALENSQNTPGAGARSGYRGVAWNEARNLWIAKVHAAGKLHYFGGFQDKEEAARVAREGRMRLQVGALD